MEIEQNESRYETYPLFQGVLDMLYSLITTAIPKNLGIGPRKPGIGPYLSFVERLFLRFYTRYDIKNLKFIGIYSVHNFFWRNKIQTTIKFIFKFINFDCIQFVHVLT